MLNNNLTRWWEEVSNEFERVMDEPALSLAMAHFAARLDFKFFAFVFRQSLPGTGLQSHLLSNYPNHWIEHYKRSSYSKVDPILRQGARTCGLVVWSDNLFSRASSFWKEAKQAGLSVGVSQSAWSRNGTYTVLSLARSSVPLDSQTAAELEPYVLLLSNIVTLRAQDILGGSLPRVQRTSLTEREIEILRWSANGKTAFEVADILGISESTINFHLHNTRRKLGVSTKLEAAAYAARQGLLD
ncbi:autoinducer binding domain-containing protein [Paraburkholderia denitrificans]|uniref:Autoinducer binding domain-containing protein n=1 Tax=Paraburkholderia denitrificans TaxID=694025 RepID=A0ABW0J781_9BURK